MEWCEPERLLSSLYGYMHHDCSALQSQADVGGFCGIWARFVQSLVRDPAAKALLLCCRCSTTQAASWSAAGQHAADRTPSKPCKRCDAGSLLQADAKEVPCWLTNDDLRTLAGAARFISCPDSVKWFPEYGCALLALPPHEAQAAAGHLSLSLLGLDDWTFHMHRCGPCTTVRYPSPEGCRSCAVQPAAVLLLWSMPARPSRHGPPPCCPACPS